MARYTLKQNIFIVKLFYQNGNSVDKVRSEFSCEFKKTKLPTDSVIVELVQLFEEFGSVRIKHVERKINSKSIVSLNDSDSIDSIKYENGIEHECNSFREKNCIEIKTEPEIFFHTDILDSFKNDAGNRLQSLVNENSLDEDHFVNNNDSDNNDEDEDDLKPLNEIRSQLLSNESQLDAQTQELNDVKNEYDNNNDLDLYLGAIVINGEDMNCDEIQNEAKVGDNQITKTNSKPNVEDETKSIVSNTILKCEECNKDFTRKRSYLRHINNHGKSCEICGKKYRDYQKHMRKHTGEKPYQCNVCGAQFIDMSRLKGHMTTHSNERPFECDLCKKTFKSRDRLHGHTKTHSKDRPIKCEICGKGFLHNGDLRKHSRTHTGEKPFVCSFCGKCFASSHSLTVHNRIHTGEKPYKCNFCDKQFNVAGSLTIHKRIHTGEKPYKCKFCEKAFYDTATCRVHVRTHTGDYPYKCVLCGKAHNHPSNLKSHMRHAHREEQG